MERINTGIIGDGWGASKHAHAINLDKNINLIAIASDDRDKAEELVKRHAILSLDFDTEYLLKRDELDAAVISVPPERKLSMTKYVLSYSKIAILDSPVSTSLDECEELLTLLDDGNFIFNSNSFLYSPPLRENRVGRYSLYFSSLNLTFNQMAQITLEAAIFAYGKVDDVAIRKEDAGIRLQLKQERGEGEILLKRDSDIYGLTLIENGREVVKNEKLYSSLPYFYSFLYSRLSDGGDITKEMEVCVDASRIVTKILPQVLEI